MFFLRTWYFWAHLRVFEGANGIFGGAQHPLHYLSYGAVALIEQTTLLTTSIVNSLPLHLNDQCRFKSAKFKPRLISFSPKTWKISTFERKLGSWSFQFCHHPSKLNSQVRTCCKNPTGGVKIEKIVIGNCLQMWIFFKFLMENRII